ncbi:MAG: hypothetical protein KC619_12220 [Myxococcales bacterium]|nr:hypothetical protein [Myxococcales bacterium]
MHRSALLSSLLALASGCTASHSGADGSVGVDGGVDCPLPAPTGCRVADPSTHCCRSVAPVCRDGAWICDPSPMGCEGGCETCDPLGASWTCYEDLGGGCCGAPVGSPTCMGTTWVCPGGAVVEHACTSPPGGPCGPPGECEGLTEAACVGSTECEPLYDDFCCPLCSPAGFCADCQRLQMHECAPRSPCGGATEWCGAVPWACDDGSPEPRVADCASAVDAGSGRCSVAGCVVRTGPADCLDCPTTCVPVRGDSCDAFCDIPAPACPPGFVPEAEVGCYTGGCIAESACLPAQPVAP